MVSSTSRLTIEEFFNLPEGDRPYELVDGQAITKMSPKFFHAAVQAALIILLQSWCQGKGRIYPEWAIRLKRKGVDWVPVPDLSYTSYDRLGTDWILDEACPVAPELAIEIISPGQTFGDLAEKATDYLHAGVARVWLIDTKSQSITVFYPDTLPQTFRGDSAITDELLPELKITPQQIFQQAGLI
ncbi:MAG: Uma2 family endonuclease [Cyanobacteria bacterium P01_G01_bin.39]